MFGNSGFSRPLLAALLFVTGVTEAKFICDPSPLLVIRGPRGRTAPIRFTYAYPVGPHPHFVGGGSVELHLKRHDDDEIDYEPDGTLVLPTADGPMFGRYGRQFGPLGSVALFEIYDGKDYYEKIKGVVRCNDRTYWVIGR